MYASLCADHEDQLNHGEKQEHERKSLSACVEELIASCADGIDVMSVDAMERIWTACERVTAVVRSMSSSSPRNHFTTSSSMRNGSMHSRCSESASQVDDDEYAAYTQRAAQYNACHRLCAERRSRLATATKQLRLEIAHVAYAATGSSMRDRMKLLRIAAPVMEDIQRRRNPW